MITQFHIFAIILTVKFMFARASGRDKEYDWYVYLLAIILMAIVAWTFAGWLVEPVNLILHTSLG